MNSVFFCNIHCFSLCEETRFYVGRKTKERKYITPQASYLTSSDAQWNRKMLFIWSVLSSLIAYPSVCEETRKQCTGLFLWANFKVIGVSGFCLEGRKVHVAMETFLSIMNIFRLQNCSAKIIVNSVSIVENLMILNFLSREKSQII